jgi:phosphoribosyl 1,2-cyclic phosphodiesterase/DNA-binding NarL/FixJ family response regulator
MREFSAHRHMKTVLLIDDEAGFSELIGHCLETEGWEVITADDGERGFRMALEHRPDIVMCDLHMPRYNGFQVCRSLRAHRDQLPQLRIVVTTGSNYPADKKNALEAGADEYLIKPVKPEALLALFEQLLLKRVPAKPASDTTRLVRVPRSTPPTVTFEATAGASADTGSPRIRFWGVRGSIPCPGPGTVHFGGNTSCVEVRADGEIIILDAGTGIRPLGRELAREFQGRPLAVTLLISHTHWDHIQGFPFFAPAYDPLNHVRILGFEGARKGLDNALSSQMESSFFPIGMSQMPGTIRVEELRDLSFSIGRVEVEAAFLNHPGITMGYRLYTSAGSVAYLPDNEPHQRLRSVYQSAESAPEVKKYATAQDQKLMDFVAEADVLIIDSQYDDAEYQSHVGWGHGCVDDVVALALIARVKHLFLFHHDPDHDDARIARMTDWARQLVRARGESLRVEAAREGVEFRLASVEE